MYVYYNKYNKLETIVIMRKKNYLNNKDIFIGYSKKDDFEKFKVARTNEFAVNEIKNIFPNKNVFSFELKKSDLKPAENALHLDCCFQPIGQGFAIIYENGFKNKSWSSIIQKNFKWWC